MKERIKAGLAALDLLDRVPPEAPEQLAEYGRLLLEKNQVMNLTAITDPDQVVKLHMLDCAALLSCADFSEKRLIDVGTGAGFPGMVLKILVPSLDVVLLDSLNKRLDWLAEVADTLGLSGLQTLHARAEEQALRPGWRDGFDIVTSRAVASLELLSELCLPYVKVGGQFLAMKAVDCEEELSRAAASASPGWAACCAPPMTTPSPAPTWSTGWSGWTRPLPPPRDTPEDGQKYRKLLCVNITPVILVYFLTITALCTNHS